MLNEWNDMKYFHDKYWKCPHCESIFKEFEAIMDMNSTERCPKCNTALGGCPDYCPDNNETE